MELVKTLMPNANYSHTFNSLLALAQEKNITVYSTRFSSIHGVWIQCGDGQEFIIIDTYRTKGKKLLFVLAHEIGHSVLHKDRIDAAAYSSDRAYHGKIEAEANEFADKLLAEIKGGDHQ